MRIGVTGYGVVGRATADVLRRLGHTVFIHDISPQALEMAINAGFGVRAHADQVEVDFICVPETVIVDALAALPADTMAIVRSTVTPGTTDALSERFERPLVFMPEFLREATAQWDAINPSFILVGCHDPEQGQLISQIFAPLLVRVIQVEPKVAEMVKLTLNSYLHTLISFWNEIHLIAERIGVPSHLVGKLCTLDPRVPAYGAVMHGSPVGGRCLPKDIAQLIGFAEGVDYEPDLLREAQRVNEKLLENLEAQVHHASSNGHSSKGQYTELTPQTGLTRLNW